MKGKIVKILGNRTFIVEIPELQKRWKRHLNQIKKFYVVPRLPLANYERSNVNVGEQSRGTQNNERDQSDDNQTNDITETTNNLLLNRPKRNIKPIDRLTYYVTEVSKL